MQIKTAKLHTMFTIQMYVTCTILLFTNDIHVMVHILALSSQAYSLSEL